MKTKLFTMALVALGLFGVLGSALADEIQGGAPDKTDYVLFVSIKVKSDTIVEFKKALLAIVEPTRAEDGNLAYLVHQSPDDSTQFEIYEHWESDEAHAEHLATPLMKNFFKKVTPMFEEGYPIRKKYIELDPS